MALMHLPPQQNLFVTTPNAIYHRSQLINNPLFECETANGIVNARASRDNSSLFVVADSHVVILCDAKRGKDKRYKLSSGDGEPRLLLFSPDSRILYFTTTLSTSVQAYSISTAQLLPALLSHPSPPNTIAVSSNGGVLLSASPDPPTIYLQDRRWGGIAPVTFRPTDARSPVTCAAFHTFDDTVQPTYTNFILGFLDGTVAMYHFFLPSLSDPRGTSHTHPMQSFQLQPVSVGAIQKLHKAAMGGVTAVEFIPGYKSRIHVSGPATCLSVVSKGKVTIPNENGAAYAGTIHEGQDTLIAIGSQAGKVLVFNNLGLLVHEITMGVPIINVEWVGDMSAASSLPNRRSPFPLEPPTVMGSLMEEIEEAANEQSGTVKRTALPKTRIGVHRAVPTSHTRDLFSDGLARRKSCLPARKPSDASDGSPLQADRTRDRPRRKSMIRPRIATETFKSPTALPCQSISIGEAGPSSPPTPPIQESRKWPQIYQTPNMPLASVARHLSASQKTSSPSQYSVASDEEFFTPPTTRRDTGKAPLRFVSPRASATAGLSIYAPKVQHRRIMIDASSSSSFDNPIIRHPRSTPRLKGRDFSFEAGLHEVEASAEQRYRKARQRRQSAGVDELREMRNNNEALREEMVALRGEFQALKDVLLNRNPRS
ncbi:Nn.00g032710.m01.CDS01 [Neocucurbitaria sp. VM-36]